MAIRMQVIDRHFCTVTFENKVDWKYPESFRYIKNNYFSSSIKAIASESIGCSCADNCKDDARCCGSDNESTTAYDNAEGIIILKNVEDENQTIIECGDQCKCNKACVKRCTQKCMNFRKFKIFKSKLCEWAIKSQSKIVKGKINLFLKYFFYFYGIIGSFIFEAVGVLADKSAVCHKPQKSYFFHFLHNDKQYVIDAHEMGNIAR